MNFKKVRFEEKKIKYFISSDIFDIWQFENDDKVFFSYNNIVSVIPIFFTTPDIWLQLVESHFLLIISDQRSFKINLLTGQDQFNIEEKFT